MRILYIDPASFIAHANYNKMQIEALYKITDNIDFVFKEGYEEELGISSQNVVYSIPSKYYSTKVNRFYNRLITMFTYFLLRRNVNWDSYDVVIVSYYDEICLFFVNLPSHVYLINHINVSGLFSSRVKTFFYKRISTHYHQIVLDLESQKYLKEIGVEDVEVVAHGLVKPFFRKEDLSILNDYNQFSWIIFSPSLTSVSDNIQKELISDSSLISFLRENNALLILRSKYLKSSCTNIQVIDGLLEKDMYEGLFIKSDVILLPYPSSFQYRTSGVLLEAISNDKKVIVNDTPYFRQFQNIGIDIRYFTSIEDVISSLEELLFSSTNKRNLIKDYRLMFMPDYTFILNKNDVE